MIHGGDVDLRVPEGAGKPGVHFEHHDLCGFDHVFLIRDAQGKGHVAVPVRRSAGPEENVGTVRVDPVSGGAVEHVRHVRHGASPGLQRLTGPGGMEPRGKLEAPLHLRPHVEVVRLEREDGEDPHVLHRVRNDVKPGHAALGL